MGWRRWRGSQTVALDWPTRCLAGFVGFSFLVWMAIFSIYRNLVPAEMLAPLLCWLLLRHLLPPRWAWRGAVWIVALVAGVGLGGYGQN